MTIFRKVATSNLGRPDATTLADLTSERDRVLWQRLIQLFPEVTKLLDSSVDPAVASTEPVTWGAARLKLQLLGTALLNLQSGDSVGQLVAMGAPLWARDASYNTPLMAAALDGRNELIQPLLDAGADVNESGRMDVTPLMQAARRGDVLGVRLLLAAGANVDARTKHGETALLLALGGGHGPVVNLLLDEGHAQINDSDPLLLVAIRSRCAADALIKRLLEAGASAHQILTGDGRAGHPNPLLERLLRAEAAASAVRKEGWMAPVIGQEGWTPLIMAAEKGNEAAVRMLVAAAGINLNVQAADGRTALMVAADQPQLQEDRQPAALPGHDAIIRQLIAARADLALRDGQGRTALMIATERGRDAAIQLLTDAAAGQLPAPAKASD
jgi:ankyrin repeat protein